MHKIRAIRGEGLNVLYIKGSTERNYWNHTQIFFFQIWYLIKYILFNIALSKSLHVIIIRFMFQGNVLRHNIRGKIIKQLNAMFVRGMDYTFYIFYNTKPMHVKNVFTREHCYISVQTFQRRNWRYGELIRVIN